MSEQLSQRSASPSMTDIRSTQFRAPSVPPPNVQAPSRISSGSSEIDTLREGYQHMSALYQSLRHVQQGVATAYTQAQQGHARDIDSVTLEAARKIKKPSKIRYYLFIGLCALADTGGAALITAAWASTAFYGAGFILGPLATLFVSGVMWIGGLIFLGKRAKEVAKHRDQLQKKSKELSRDIQVVEQQYQNVLAWFGAAKKQFPQLASQGSALIVKAGAVAGKTNAVKYTGKAMLWLSKPRKATNWLGRLIKNPFFTRVSEIIPGWNIIPWWTVGAGATYISHRADWREAQDILHGYTEGKQKVMATTDNLYKARLTVAQVLFRTNADILSSPQLHEPARP